MEEELLLKMENISKHFPGVQALSEVNLEVYKSEILALVGENGAGKSTLMKILTGVYPKDEGTIFFKGRKIEPQNPRHAQELGISIIHQEFNLAPNLDIATNIFLGNEPKKGRFIKTFDYHKAYVEAKRLLDLLGLNISPNTLVKELTVAQQQIVEIAKALAIKSELIIMDEPTSALAGKEVENLFNIMKRLKSEGISIIFITHRLEEVFQIADRIIVLRDGKRVGELPGQREKFNEVIRLMVGRDVIVIPKPETSRDEVVLEVKNLSSKFVKDISFSLKRGEVLGIAGLVGAGRTEIVRAIFGADPKTSGEIFLEGKKLEIRSPKDVVRAGIGLVPEDRKLQGLILNMAVYENVTLTILPTLFSNGLLKSEKEFAVTKEYVDKLGIKTSNFSQKVNTLSGGNQQKVILAKWLALKPKVLILDEPTRGIDVGAKAEIHSLIGEMAKEGIGIILISSELPEILALSDRILVISKGRITAEINKKDASQEKIMQYAIL
ncbi:MAG TPA: sugar ABC transporter ATP-binding protein [Dictyoglomaceae bacterium]|nr:sugar ABC transporter ATP-binding protein [Dictyoglomaceae bacterium]HOL39659.1 sugar ABC transporter ATP-binding protein [Dictyoglomaceae bacterium]HOP94805.1 sugar ABC transporter ATP-binding protein [Dictyoglomaceae bacterium]HPP16072.1 sugar ABC transporter ATP-binding protein [Dictyoglomaceae bacterium]HPU43300.1 sugar ABC transporter ATP-binding protein [Dictyoglomaceae bacterium]